MQRVRQLIAAQHTARKRAFAMWSRAEVRAEPFPRPKRPRNKAVKAGRFHTQSIGKKHTIPGGIDSLTSTFSFGLLNYSIRTA
ncbi:hypothetical protein Rcae01_03684 [Novipirellula caenicola]|uniref:Uncharacterized protein n=1 Tax=Novipirellula caenicola TaxID=1536901 RepID=A0ABP9VVF6_9BACT